MAEYKQLSDGRPDGFLLGKDASDKWCAHGGTPTTQDANIDDVLSTVISTAATSDSPFGFATAAQADAITDVIEDCRTTINAVLDVLINKGFVASS
jgi:hypothetical protein